VRETSTAARLAHDLGLAVCFGGTLFGKVVFNPTVAVVASKPERGRVGGTTWNRFNVLNAASFALAAATWLPGRLRTSGNGMDRRTRSLLLAKDALMGVTTLSGLTAIVVQILLYYQAPGGAVPLETGSVPAPEAGNPAHGLQRTVGALGSVNSALFAALIATTTLLSAEADGPARRGGLRRPR
jgi:hypothetical protein